MLPRILIIDDVALNTVMLKTMVDRLQPCDAVCFTSASAALESCRETAPDLILLDYVMPELDGAAFLTALRAIEHCRSVPVLVITTQSDRASLMRALEAGANDFLHKPVDPVELRARVRNALDLGTALTQLRHLATTDALTGMLNRRSFLARLADESDRAHRYGHSFCVAMFDVDHFKSINDRFGHAAGDAALIAIADVCREVMRRPDAIGRLGGEEFGVVMPGTTLAGAELAAERLRAATAGCSLSHVAAGMSVTISIGVAEYAEHETDHALLARADVAMYRAKASGRDRVAKADGAVDDAASIARPLGVTRTA